MRQYEAAVQIDQGGIANARLQLTHSRIVAPISGRVGLRQVDPGNIVRAADTNGIVMITQLQPDRRRVPDPGGRPAAGDEAAAQPAIAFRSTRSTARRRKSSAAAAC